ncbi:major facilitator superfamily domain-containing protein [Aspergillus novoparasiticus]|uniref:Major facilitator superfamily domain-containing protein n=1 Tax=Aspergillus novoparasiticus TaxID=986946 RepID=A0A5N6ENJ3_9EURO|nr:major facilitator superfamily domain-containing protein [Aspergillus novoparasiticus]
MSSRREYDLILLGATGYTGMLTTQYIFKSLPLDLKWAIAGRNKGKLEQLARSLMPENSSRQPPDILVVNLNNKELDGLAKRTRLVISTVGPFLLYGSETFAACARNGTHYLDCNGEIPWLKNMIHQYDKVAKETGSIMIPCCGFDCVPSDLSTWLAARYIRRHFNAQTGRVDVCIHGVQGGISGGTLASVLQAFELHSLRHLYNAHAPYSLSPRQPSPTVPIKRTSIWTKVLGLLWIKRLGWMAYQPQGPVDRAIVHRSWGLLESTTVAYGHNFDFHAWFKIWGPVAAILWHLGGLMLAPLILLRPVRKLLPKLWYEPGGGAGQGKIENNWFEYRCVAEADTPTKPKQKALVRMRYESDPYIFTAVALGEAARILLWQNDTWAHKFGGGVLTSATLGDHYVSRLRAAGVTMEVQADDPVYKGKDPFIKSTPPDTEPNYPTGTKFWFTVIALCVILILGGLDANIVATAVPSITNHFHTLADVGWYSSAFRLCTCAFQFGFAKLYTLFSIKIVFMTSNVIFLVGSVLCATAASSTMFIVGRAVTGLGFAGELAGCFAVLAHILPLNRRPVFAGLMAINLPIGTVSLAVMFFLFSDPRTRQEDDLTLAQKIRELDLVSNCLFIPSLTALFIALSWAGTKYPWSDGKVIGLFVVFAVLLTVFLINQYRRGDSAALPFRIIKNRNVIAGFIFTTCTNSMTNVLEWYLPTYYQVVRSRSPSESGYLMIPILAGMMLGLLLQGIGTTTFGYYAPFMVLGSVCMPIAAGLMTTYNPHTSLAQIILYSGLAGFGGGIGFQGPQAAIQTTLSAADLNLGIGVILFGQSMGPAVFIAIAQVIFTNQLSSRLEGVVPGLTPAYIAERGLGDIKNMVPMQQWDEVSRSIDRSLTRTWYLSVALGCTTVVGSLLIEWRSVKQKQS